MAGANLTIGVNNSQFKTAMSDMNKDLKGIKSEFNLASTKAKLYGTEMDQLAVKKTDLTKKIELNNNQLKLTKERMSGAQSEMTNLKNKQSDLSVKIEDTNKKYQESITLTGKNSDESKRLKEELDKTKDQYARNEKAIQSKGKELEKLNINLNDSEAELLRNKKALEDVAEEMRKMPFDNVAKGFDTVGNGAISVGKKMSVVSGGIVAVGGSAFKMAADYEDSMAKVMTIADETELSQADLKKAIMDLSDQTGISANEIAENVYNAISAGQSTADAVAFVGESTKLAKAGFAEAGQSLDVLTTILNAYGLEADEATRVSDILVQTQNKGKTTVGELSSSMGKIIPTAKAVNVGIEQLGAGYAVMTSNGIATAETTTYMNSMLNELGKSGSKASDLLKETTGKTFQELMTGGSSLSDVLVIMSDEATKNGLSLSDMFGSAEAGKAALTLVTDNGKAFNDVLKDMESSAGSTNEAFEKVSNTNNQQMKEGFNAAKNALMDLGNEMLVGATPIIKDLTDGVKVASEWFRNLDSDTKQNIIRIGGMVAAIGPGLIAFGSLSKGIGNSVRGLRDMHGGLTKGITKFKEFTPQIKDGVKSAANLATNLGKGALEFGKFAVQTGVATVKTLACNTAQLAGTIATNGLAVAQGALNLVMSLNPIGLIIIGIGLLIGGIVLLWNKCEWFRDGLTGLWTFISDGISSFCEGVSNFFGGLWDSVSTKTSEMWNSTTEYLSGKWEGIKTSCSEKWNAMKTNISTSWDNVKTNASQKWTEITTNLSTSWEDIKTNASTKFGDMKNTISTSWDNIKTATSEKLDKIKSLVSDGVEKLKGFMNFDWKLPKIKMPHFKISGEFSLNPPRVPSFGIDWYHTGAIFNKRTVLPGGIGVGDKFKGTGDNAEAIVPLDSMYRNIESILANLLKSQTQEITVYIENATYLDSDEISRHTTKKVIKELGREQRSRKVSKGGFGFER